MTLDEMIQKTAGYINEVISKDGLSYSGEDLEKANKIISSINYAYMKVCREKVNLEYKETITPGTLTSALNKKLLKANKIVNSYGKDIYYSIDAEEINFDEDDATIYYSYIPNELANLTDVPETPVTVDHKGFCFYAAFEYLMSQGRDYFSWLDLFNDFLDNIKYNRGNQIKKVVNIYD